MFCQLSSTELDAHCDKLSTVVGQPESCRRSTFDRRRLLPVYHTRRPPVCVQHDMREAARRAGPSAAASTFFTAVLAMGLCLSVRLSVTSRCFIETDDRIEHAFGL